MDRNLASAIAFASTATLAVLLATAAPGSAYADDITIDTAPSPVAVPRAEGPSKVFNRAAPTRVDANEWTMQSNQPLVLKSASTRGQAQSEYKASRDHVSALLGEDSGSAYFIKSPQGANGTATMGGPSR